MGKKVKVDHTPKQPRLDDNLRWLPIEQAHGRLTQRLGDLATLDMQQALEQGQLRCMVRLTVTGERKWSASRAWTNQIKLENTPAWTNQIGVRVVHRPQPGELYPDTTPLRGWAFYVWQPDFDRIWPPAGSAPVEHEDDSDTLPPVKPGKKPRGNWPTLIAQWLIAVAADDPQRLQNVDALVVEAQEFLDEQIKWSPSDDKVLRAKIRELLKLVPR